MAANLGDFLERHGGLDLAWGLADCMIFPCDWMLAATGLDPAARWRGTYHTAREAQMIVRREGGMVALMAKGAQDIGAVGVNLSEAPTGAMGIVIAPTAKGPQEMGAIKTSIGWAVFCGSGVLVGQYEALGAWAVI